MTATSRPFDGGPFGTSGTSGGGAGGDSVTLDDWTQLLVVSEASGVPVDTTPLGDTGTGFTGGLARVVYTSSTTQLDGHRENLLRWSYPLLSLYDDFDPTTDELELMLDFRAAGGGQLPSTAAANGALAFIGLADRTTADLANLNAAMIACGVTGVGAYGIRHVFSTSAAAGSGGLVGSTPDAVYQALRFGETPGSGNYRVSSEAWAHVPSGSNWVVDTTATGQASLSSTLANWSIQFGALHLNTTAATGQDIRWRVFYRRQQRHATLLPT